MRSIPRFGLIVTSLAVGVLTLLVSACGTLGYLGQAGMGHLKLVSKKEPVSELLADPSLDPTLRRQLAESQAMRDFASEQLALPDNDSYREYVATGRDAVVWNVIAAPATSLQAKTWCFPIAGCVPYRGYFNKDSASEFAAGLASDGWDTTVSPATAYSTLGWFDDPLTDTMLAWQDFRLAALIFHELAHQQLYVKGQAEFNESFASAVAVTGVQRWLAWREANPRDWLDYRQRQQDFSELLASTRASLAALYQSDMDNRDKLAGKQEQFAKLRQEYQALKQRWGGFTGYDAWMARDLNNAHLALHATYQAGEAAFLDLLAACGDDLPRFYAAAQKIAGQPADQRQAFLQQQNTGRADCTPTAIVTP